MNEKTYKYTDRELLIGVKNGEQASLATLYANYRNRLFRESYYIVKDVKDAEDIIQEVFMSIWKRRSTIPIEENFLPYLLQATWNLSLKCMQGRMKNEERERMYYYLSPKFDEDQPFDKEELAQLLDKALQLVPPAARRSFILQYMEGHNQQSVAIQQNISLQVVKNNVSQALRILREALKSRKSF